MEYLQCERVRDGERKRQQACVSAIERVERNEDCIYAAIKYRYGSRRKRKKKCHRSYMCRVTLLSANFQPRFLIFTTAAAT